MARFKASIALTFAGLAGRNELVNREVKLWERRRNDAIGSCEAGFFIEPFNQDQHHNLLLFQVNDPIFWDPFCCIFRAFVAVVSGWIVRGNHFNHQNRRFFQAVR